MTAQDNELVVSYLTLRQMIGWVGLLMPFAVRLGAMVFEHIHSTNSISAYYYTGMRDVFVSTLVLVGALLSCYRTPSESDNIIAIVAGMAAVGIGLFPTEPVYAAEVLRNHPDMATAQCYVNRGILGYHFIFVAIFFALTFYLVYFRFSAFTPKVPTRQKLLRNRIYKICGAAMLVGFVAIALLAFFHKGASIFWPETLAVVAFATAWLVKGRLVLKDPTSVIGSHLGAIP
jgi:hypothetical protein